MDQAIYFVIPTACVIALAYRFYGSKILTVDDKEARPLNLLQDGNSYVPTKNWVNAGQCFAAPREQQLDVINRTFHASH